MIFIGGRGFGKVAAMKARIAELERDNVMLHKKLVESELKVKEPTLFQELYLTSPAVHYAIKSEIRKIKNLEGTLPVAFTPTGINPYPLGVGFKFNLGSDLATFEKFMEQAPLMAMCGNPGDDCDCGYHKILRGHEDTPYPIPYLQDRNNGTPKSTG